MQTRTGWRVLGTIALLCAIAAVGICTTERTDSDAPAAVPTQPSGSAAPAIDPAARAEADAQRERARQRDEAMYAAVSTLQKYLAALARGGDHSEADAFWANGHPRRNSGEADLRTLHKLRGMRIENGTPAPLDSNAVPDALQIPVELRVGVEDAPLRRYRGWYRLRRAGADRWQITSASIEVVPRVE